MCVCVCVCVCVLQDKLTHLLACETRAPMVDLDESSDHGIVIQSRERGGVGGGGVGGENEDVCKIKR